MTELAKFDQSFFSPQVQTLAGADEVGRGPLAGPVVAAICSMPKGLSFDKLNDSKCLSDKIRRFIDFKLRHHPRVAWSIAFVSPKKIDQHNIQTASLIAMAQALQNLKDPCDFLLVDGIFLPHRQKIVQIDLAQEKTRAIVKGDKCSQVIAAASVLAKVARDDYMMRADLQWPAYGFAKHKGYATQQHIAALTEFGPCPIHRLSFQRVIQPINR